MAKKMMLMVGMLCLLGGGMGMSASAKGLRPTQYGMEESGKKEKEVRERVSDKSWQQEMQEAKKHNDLALAMHEAICNRKLEEFKMLMEQNKVDPNSLMYNGKSWLYQVCYEALFGGKGFPEFVKYLLEDKKCNPELGDFSMMNFNPAKTPLECISGPHPICGICPQDKECKEIVEMLSKKAPMEDYKKN